MTLTSQSNSDVLFAVEARADDAHDVEFSAKPQARACPDDARTVGYPVWRIPADSVHLKALQGVLSPTAFVTGKPDATGVFISPTSADEMLFLMALIDDLEQVA